MIASLSPLAAAIATAVAAEDGITFAPGHSVGRTGDLVPCARGSTVSLLKQFSDPFLLRCIGLECLGAYSLETLTRGLHARKLQPHERRKLQEAIDIGVDPERLADIVDHVAFHSARRVWLEKNARILAWRRRDIDQRAAGVAPDAMPFGLDEHAWPLPYSPSDACLAAHALHLLVDVVKATTGHCSINWVRHQEQRTRLNAEASRDELKNVSVDLIWRDRHSSLLASQLGAHLANTP